MPQNFCSPLDLLPHKSSSSLDPMPQESCFNLMPQNSCTPLELLPQKYLQLSWFNATDIMQPPWSDCCRNSVDPFIWNCINPAAALIWSCRNYPVDSEILQLPWSDGAEILKPSWSDAPLIWCYRNPAANLTWCCRNSAALFWNDVCCRLIEILWSPETMISVLTDEQNKFRRDLYTCDINYLRFFSSHDANCNVVCLFHFSLMLYVLR